MAASAVWPSVEAIVSKVFVGVCVPAGLALVVVIGRLVHGPQAGRTAPVLSELREIA